MGKYHALIYNRKKQKAKQKRMLCLVDAEYNQVVLRRSRHKKIICFIQTQDKNLYNTGQKYEKALNKIKDLYSLLTVLQ